MMGTRATLIFKYAQNDRRPLGSSWDSEKEIFLYRHYDGYPEETMYDILAVIALEGYNPKDGGTTNLKCSTQSLADRLIGLSSTKQFFNNQSFKSQYRPATGVSGDSEFTYTITLTRSEPGVSGLITVACLNRQQWSSSIWDTVCDIQLPPHHPAIELKSEAASYTSNLYPNFGFNSVQDGTNYRFVPETWQNIWRDEE